MIGAGRFRAAGKIDKIGQNIQRFVALRIDLGGFGRLDRRASNKSIAAGPAADPENMGGLNFRVQLDVISASVPDVTRIAEKVVHLIRVAFHFTELIDGNIDIGILFVV